LSTASGAFDDQRGDAGDRARLGDDDRIDVGRAAFADQAVKSKPGARLASSASVILL
jgi:hypothetical protein